MNLEKSTVYTGQHPLMARAHTHTHPGDMKWLTLQSLLAKLTERTTAIES